MRYSPVNSPVKLGYRMSLPEDLIAAYGVEIIQSRLLAKRKLEPRRQGFENCWIWTGALTSRGYGCLALKRYGELHRLSTHRIALAAWTDFDLDGEYHALHRCDQKDCFNPDHLYAGTRSDNMADAYVSGLLAPLQPHRSLLVEDDIFTLLDSLLDGEKRSTLAREYGVGWQTIDDVVKGKTWRETTRRWATMRGLIRRESQISDLLR